MDFDAAVRDLGFATERVTRDATLFEARPNPFLTYTLHAFDNGTALFTWEFAIGAYAATRGLQVGSDEHLNSFLYPREDVRGPRDPAWVAAQIERTELLLRSFSLVEPD